MAYNIRMANQSNRETTRALWGSGTPNKKGVIRYRVKSETRPGVTHIVAAQVGTARVHCTCEDFTNRCAKFKPSISFGPVCKHIRTYKVAIIRDLSAADVPDARGVAVSGLTVDYSKGYAEWVPVGR